MTAQSSLPRKPSSAAAPTFPALSDLQDALKFTPAFEVKTFDLLAGDYPLRMNTRLPGFYGLSVVGCWEKDTGTPVVAGNVAWRLGIADGDIDVTSIGSLTAGTKYRVTVEMRGRR